MSRDAVRTPSPSLPPSPQLSRAQARVSTYYVNPGIPLRILLPIIKPPPLPPQAAPHRSPRAKQTGVKLGRTSRSGSFDLPAPPGPYQKIWHKTLGRLEVQQENVELKGYQIYAVEKWVVERSKLVTTVVVYTGDAQHQIYVAALAPPSYLSETDAKLEFEHAVFELRRDGVRPKETSQGVIMITSLPNFRSDLTIVPIPGGNFATMCERLYVNIDLLRMGCSGRSALTLDEPYSSSKDKFMQLYNISESILSDNYTFQTAVLQLIQVVQSALSIFDMFPLAEEERNGLLCDETVTGIQRWTLEVGPYLELEPMERLLDPSAIAALLSLIISTRNKLAALGISQVPKDPLAEPVLFLQALTIYERTTKHAFTNAILDLDILHRINTSYAKSRQTEPYKVHRVLKHKLDDLTIASTSLATNLNLRSAPELSSSLSLTQSINASTEFETSDLEAFVKFVSGSGNVPESVKYIWTGKKQHHHHANHLRKADRSKDAAALKPEMSEKEDRVSAQEVEESETIGDMIWRGTEKVQKKGQALVEGITGWTGRDFGRSRKANESETMIGSPSVAQHSSLPSLVISCEPSAEGDTLMQSPISQTPLDLTSLKGHPYSAASSSTNLSAINQSRLSKFLYMISLASVQAAAGRGAKQRWEAGFRDDFVVGNEILGEKKKVLDGRRRQSFSHTTEFAKFRAAPLDRMKIDVGICGQYIELLEREKEMSNAAIIMKELLRSLTSINSRLLKTVESQRHSLSLIESQRYELTGKTHNARKTSEEMNKKAKTLGYQAEKMEEEEDRLQVRVNDHDKRREDVVDMVVEAYVLEVEEEGGKEKEKSESATVEESVTVSASGEETTERKDEGVDPQALRRRLLPWFDGTRKGR